MNKKERKFFTDTTREQLDSVCLWYRHDYGLLEKNQQELIRDKALYWIEAWLKELRFLTK